MASYKRRRAINIDLGYIEALKNALKSRSGDSATGLANLIFRGEEKPLKSISKQGKTKGVSMTEAMWLSIRRRAMVIGRSATKTAQYLLTGQEPPLTDRELAYGLERAREREEKRASGAPEEAVEAKEESEEVEPESPESAPIAEETVEASPKPQEQPPHQKDKENDPSETIRDMREAEREKENRRALKLSQGHPFDPEVDDARKEKKIKPGQDFYGGIFSI